MGRKCKIRLSNLGVLKRFSDAARRRLLENVIVEDEVIMCDVEAGTALEATLIESASKFSCRKETTVSI